MTPDKLPVNNTWQLKEHDRIERPYWEITNGPISLCVDDEDIEDKDIIAMQFIVNALNSGGIKFRSENALELKQHIEIMQLRDQAQRMADAFNILNEAYDAHVEEKQMLIERYPHLFPNIDNYIKPWVAKAKEFLQQFKDGKGIIKNEVCTCDNIQLAAHGECWACPGRLTKDGKGKEVECPKCKRMVKEGWACQECSTKV